MRRPFRILLAIVVLFVVWSAWDYVEARRLERAMAHLLERANLLGPPPPATGPIYAEDAARFYDAATDLTVYRGTLLTGKVLSRNVGSLSPEDMAAARGVLAENSLAFEIVSRAANVPMRDRDSEYRERPRSGQPLNSLFAHLSFRTCALARDGRLDAAAAALIEHLAALRMFDRLARAPIGSHLGTPTAKASMLLRAIDDLELLLNIGRPSALSLERLQQAFAVDLSHDLNHVLIWEIHLLSEVAPTVPLLTRYTATGMRIPAFTPPIGERLLLPAIRREQARAADVVSETIEASSEPVPARLAHLKAIYDAHSYRRTIVSPWSTTPAIVDLSLRAARSIAIADARARCATVSLAVERYRTKTGRMPSAVSELIPTYLDTVPLDPFGTGPLRYVADAAAYSVYSVGPNGKDDGGDFQEKPDPKTGRRQPPVDVGIRIAIR